MAGELGEVAGQALAHVLDAGGVVGLHSGELLADGGHVAQDFGGKGLAFVVAELLHGGQRLGEQGLQLGPGNFFGGGLGLAQLGGAGDDAGQAQGGQQVASVAGRPRLCGHGLQLVVGREQASRLRVAAARAAAGRTKSRLRLTLPRSRALVTVLRISSSCGIRKRGRRSVRSMVLELTERSSTVAA